MGRNSNNNDDNRQWWDNEEEEATSNSHHHNSLFLSFIPADYPQLVAFKNYHRISYKK